MLDELEWPSLEACRDRSSLFLFHKIHSGAVSIEKDNYLTPAHSLKSTRSSHSAQYCRYQTYSDALKNSFFPRTIPQWNSLSPSVVNPRLLRSLGHSSFSQKHSRKIFLAFLFCSCFFFFFILFCLFLQNSRRNDQNVIAPVIEERKKENKENYFSEKNAQVSVVT